MDQRTVLTKSRIRDEISRQNKAAIVMINLLGLPLLLVGLLFSLVIQRWFTWVIWCGILLVYATLLFLFWFAYLRDCRAPFRFVKEKLTGKTETEQYSRGGTGHSTKCAFYFSHYARKVVSRGDYALADVGDDFILVMLDGCEAGILACYNAKFYRTEEWDG
jgi:hypothetical protein